MNTITVKNLSTLMDFAAVGRVAHLMSGDEYAATHDGDGKERVSITKRGSVYTVLDKDSESEG